MKDYEAAIEILGRLQARFPEVIARPEQRERRPLKVGIHDDVVALFPEVDRKIIGRALMLYTRHVAYQRGLAASAARVDLNGVETGPVTPADAEHARGQVAKLKVRAATRKAAKAAAQETRAEQPPKPEQATKADRLAVGIANLRAAAKARQAK
jgi:sRNA-binding protein